MASQGRGARAKGSNYERGVAKKFTDWWIPKGSEVEFHRAPASGALQWASDHRVAGDIVPPEGINFPFVIECKKHEGWTMDHVLLDIGTPKDWWGQVVTDSRRVDRVPMLVFSRNRAKDFVMVPHDEWLYKRLSSLGNTHMRTTISFKNIRDEVQSFDVIVTQLDILTQILPDAVREYAGNVNWDPYADQYK